MPLGATRPTVQQIELASRALAAPIWIDVVNLLGEDRERIKLRAEPESPDLQYVLDRQTLGRTSANVLWKVRRGEHILQLRSEQNAVLESVSFTVR